jgi:hypothetical protein
MVLTMTPEERADRIASAVYPPLTPFLVSEIAAAIRVAENAALERAVVALINCDGVAEEFPAALDAIRAVKHDAV